jgi:hypothetical protein
VLKKDVEEFKRNGGETMVTQVECPYCHQRIMAEVMPDFDTLDENLRRQLAVEYCTCEEAVFEALMLNRYEKLEKSLTEMFGEESEMPIGEDTLKTIKDISEQVCRDTHKKVTVNIDEYTKLVISVNSKGFLNIQKETKNIRKQIV